ncbi:MAG: protoporphyrinogen oxidase [Bradymonadaceae bacterium]|nr:protoporphyrinogen oxidase [Lujinxingiaceae bacterium]
MTGEPATSAQAATSIAIIGAGISGLTLALRLKELGHSVCVYEASERVGGPIHTVDFDGFVVEHGPHTLLEKSRSLQRFIDHLGLGPKRLEASPLAKKRYVVRHGQPVALPGGPGAFASTPLFSARAKLRLLAEPFVGKTHDADESLASFVSRRLGQEVLDYAVDPFVAGTYAGDPKKLSVRHAFPMLDDLQAQHGSLFRGLAARALGPKNPERAPHKVVSFEGGLSTLINTLEAKLGEDVILRAAATAIAFEENQWQLSYQKKNRTSTHAHDAIVFCMPAHKLAGLDVRGRNAQPIELGRLDAITYSPIALVALGFERARVDHPLDGLGMLVPGVENFRILGTLFTSSMFARRAPLGHVNLTTFVGGARQPHLVDEDEATIVEMVRVDLHRLLGANGTPSFVHVSRYARAIPQYEVGYAGVLAHIDTLEAENDGLFFGGNYRDGIAVPALIDAANARALRIDEHLANHKRSSL